MKINVEFDTTPEELRRFLGLPDIQEVQNKVIAKFSERLEASVEQQDEFLKGLFKTAMEPWQIFNKVMEAGSKSAKKSKNKPDSEP